MKCVYVNMQPSQITIILLSIVITVHTSVVCYSIEYILWEIVILLYGQLYYRFSVVKRMQSLI